MEHLVYTLKHPPPALPGVYRARPQLLLHVSCDSFGARVSALKAPLESLHSFEPYTNSCFKASDKHLLFCFLFTPPFLSLSQGMKALLCLPPCTPPPFPFCLLCTSALRFLQSGPSVRLEAAAAAAADCRCRGRTCLALLEAAAAVYA